MSGRLYCFSVLVLAMVVALAACVGPVAKQDLTPAGAIKDIAASAKRPANVAEQQALQSTLAALPGVSAAQVQVMNVEAAAKPVRAFCAAVSGLGELGGNNNPAPVAGMLKTVEGRELAYDFRFGEFAAQRCKLMGF